MEPIYFIATVKDGKCEVWGGLQRPNWTVSDIAEERGPPGRKRRRCHSITGIVQCIGSSRVPAKAIANKEGWV